MRVTPDHLLTFAEVAAEGNLTRAAARLNLTQPAVSAQLKQLQDAVGEPLYVRRPGGVRLTPAGEGLLPHALATRRALDGARRYAADLRGGEAGEVRVAASNTLAAYLLPLAASNLRAHHPNVRIEVTVGNTREVTARLAAGECDLALVEGPPAEHPAGTEAEVLGTDHLRLVLPPAHPLAGRAVRPADLQGLGVVWREAGSGTREVAERALAHAGVTVSTALELAGTEAVKEAVMRGLGAAFLSELSVRRERAAGLLDSPELHLPGLARELTLLRPVVLGRAADALRGELLRASGRP